MVVATVEHVPIALVGFTHEVQYTAKRYLLSRSLGSEKGFPRYPSLPGLWSRMKTWIECAPNQAVSVGYDRFCLLVFRSKGLVFIHAFIRQHSPGMAPRQQ